MGLSLTLSCLAVIRLPEILAVVSSDKYSVVPQLATFPTLLSQMTVLFKSAELPVNFKVILLLVMSLLIWF